MRNLGNLALILSLVALAASGTKAQELNLEELAQAAQETPDNPASQSRYADALLRAGEFAQAQRAWEAAARLQRGNASAAYDIARPSFEQDDYRTAQRACRTVERIERNGIWARVCRARAFLVWNRSGRAFGELEAALATEANHYEALLALGDAHRLLGARAEALEAYQRAERASPGRARTSLALGLLYTSQQQQDLAFESLRASVEQDGNDPRSLLAYANVTSPSDALSLLQRAQAIRNRWAPLNVAYGNALLASGNASGAKDQFELAVAEQGDLPQAHCGLGQALTSLGEYEAAEASLQRSLELVPNYADAVFALAEMYAASGSRERAYAEYRRASGLDPSNPRSLFSAAQLAMRANRDVLAAGFLDRLFTRHPQHAGALALYGDIMVIRRESAAARDYYQRALAGQGPVDRARIQSALAGL